MPRKRHYTPASSRRMMTRQQVEKHYHSVIKNQIMPHVNFTPDTFHAAATKPAPAPADHQPRPD